SQNEKGLATHLVPESWVGARESTGQALTGVRTGRVLSCEIHAPWLQHGIYGVPTRWRLAEGNIDGADIARRPRTPRGQRPRARTDAPRTGAGRSHDRLHREMQSASGSLRTNADDERAWEVGQ